MEGIKEGDRVGIPFLHYACGKCEFCTYGWENYCPYQLNSGYTVEGCYRQYATVPAAFAAPIPENIPSEAAARKYDIYIVHCLMVEYSYRFLFCSTALLCAGMTVYKGLKEANIRAGQFVCIVGAGGGLGHLGIQYAKAMGYRVIAIDFGEEKRQYCESLGAELSLDASKGDPREEIKQFTNGGPHATLVIVSHPAAFQMAVDYSRRKGIIVALSMPAGLVELDMTSIVLRGLTIKGSAVGTRQDLQEALDFAARGLVKPHIQVEDIDNVNDVMSRIASNSVVGRVVLKL